MYPPGFAVYITLTITGDTVATAPHFDAARWIAGNTQGGRRLTLEATAAVGDFTLMWNLFEDIACNNEANVRTFEGFVSRIDFAGLPQDYVDALDECLTFWRFRYRTPVGFADRFFSLNFRKNDRQELVEAVLQEHELGQAKKLLALMVIVYRLRNNLFHGIKSLEMLNDQVPNLNTASRCLGLILNVAQSHLIRHPMPRVQRRSQSPASGDA
jgi:hypothetical protein